MNYEQRSDYENLLLSYLENNPDHSDLILKIFIDISILTEWSGEDIISLLNNVRLFGDSESSDRINKSIDYWLEDRKE